MAVDATGFPARHLDHGQAGLGGADREERLDLEAVGVWCECLGRVRPESIEAVAEIGVARAEEEVDQPRQHEVSNAPEQRDVRTTSSGKEPGALHEVGAGVDRLDEARELTWVG